MSKLYLECYSGISGDMTVGALLGLGADRGKLEKALGSVPAEGFRIQISQVLKSGIEAWDFDVILDEAHENHDHDMEWLFGAPAEAPHVHGDAHAHSRGEESGCHSANQACAAGFGQDEHHTHEGHSSHDAHPHGGHHHEHRNLEQVYAILDRTQMSENARALARRIFGIVAEAEAEVHGKSIDEVHFHEVGAIDSIADIIAIAVCYDDLQVRENITEVIVPVLYEGTGTVRCQHGILPIPVPAVAAIARSHGLRLHIMPDAGEFVTPTGAAVAAALRTGDELPSEFVIRKTGLGAGKREYKRAGILRAMLLEG